MRLTQFHTLNPETLFLVWVWSEAVRYRQGDAAELLLDAGGLWV